MAHSGRVGRYTAGPPGDKKAGGAEQQLAKICCDANKVALEQVKGISGQVRLQAWLAPDSSHNAQCKRGHVAAIACSSKCAARAHPPNQMSCDWV